MSKYIYSVGKGQSINCWKRGPLMREVIETEVTTFDAPVNDTEGYQEVEYPVRKKFLENLDEIQYPSTELFSEIYLGFENPRIDFSTFQATPHKVSTFLQVNLDSPMSQVIDCAIVTCGRASLWLNGDLVIDFHPYTRNHGTEKKIQLDLQIGKNDLVLYMDDLAERDVNFFVQLKILSECHLDVVLPLDFDSCYFETAKEFLEGLYFEKDYYSSGEVLICSDSKKIDRVRMTYQPVTFLEDGSGNLSDFERQDKNLKMSAGKFSLGEVDALATSGLTTVYLGCQLPNDSYLYKKLVFTVYNEAKLDHSLGETLQNRKDEALRIFAQLDLNEMNSALASIYLEGKLSNSAWQKLQPAFQMIQTRGDCADFMFAPLLSFLLQKSKIIPERYAEKIHGLALNFRYWIDEPGNDVMWYFSENHSLLFHTCQYFSGYLYQDEQFTTSKRYGKEQYQLGKERLLKWFHQFETYGFSEWNSTTYLPIDLIGFFSLYNAAPDEDIRMLAKKALDFTFKIIAINYHGGTLSSTFGRTYEHDLKAMRLGEISNILAIAWNCGHFNYALRASTLFCLSDYQPPEELISLFQLKKNQYLTANYLQGVNGVETYLYKCPDYSIASGIQYRCFESGHQQHMMNVSLGNDGTQLWLNHPGEYMHSGENRPSYWAGNGVLPCIKQVKNVMRIHYHLQNTDIQFVHLYLPFWCLDEIDASDSNWLFIKKAQGYLAIHFENGYQISTTGDTRKREIVSFGENHQIIVKCGNDSEFESFSKFKEVICRTEVSEKSFSDPQWGNIKWDEREYEASYTITPVVQMKEGIDFEYFKEK